MYDNDIYNNSTSGQYSGAQSGYSAYPVQAAQYDNTGSEGFNNTESQGGQGGQVDWGKPKEVPSNVKKSKEGGFFKKLVLSVSLGLFFGIFAGIGFYAVQQGMGLVGKEVKSDAIELPFIDSEDNNSQNVPDRDANYSGVKNVSYVSSDISEVVENVMPAMVSIINRYTDTTSFWGRQYTEDYEASGSGIVVAKNDNELLIVSNNHVVEDANELEVTFINGSTAEARIKGTDPEMDLAVISVSIKDLDSDTIAEITVAELGDSDSLRLGEPVIAIGNALGYGQSVTNGIVSALDREIELEDGSVNTFIQTNAAINPGNSGGALLNINGEVIGINSNKIGGSAVEGMGYAIPITSASPIIADLMERQTRYKVAEGDMGYIGIELQEVTSEFSRTFGMPVGIYVVKLTEGGAAEKAGIMVGDIITKFDKQKVTSYAELQDILQYYAADDTVNITVMRPESGQYVEHELEITLGRRPAGNR